MINFKKNVLSFKSLKKQNVFQSLTFHFKRRISSFFLAASEFLKSSKDCNNKTNITLENTVNKKCSLHYYNLTNLI